MIERRPSKSEREPSNESEKIAQDLLRGELNGDAFLKKIIELDQRTPQREDAYANYRVLNRPDIANHFKESEFRNSYFNYLSISCFHIGQDKAIRVEEKDLRDDEEHPATPYFKEAVEAAREIENDSTYDGWVAYVEATSAYFEKDTERLSAAISHIEEGPNKRIAEKCLAGLRERGYPDYIRDYDGR